MKFIVDSMLGRLARWLRLLGYDTLYYPEIEDRLLLRIAREEERLLLTRDTRIIRVRGLQNGTEFRAQKPEMRPHGAEIRYFLVDENNPFQQLRAVIRAFNLKGFSLLSRCAICNTPLTGIQKAEVKNLVPEYVYQTSDIFKKCSGCDKLYWKGTHPEKFKEKFSEILTAS